MTEPRTEAGRALLARFDRMADRSVWLRGLLNAPTILAIEAEAATGVHLGDEGLDAAWARAEAALPEHLDERSLSVWWDNRKPAGWWAACTHRFDPLRPIPLIVKGYPTKEAALNALAAALTEGDSR